MEVEDALKLLIVDDNSAIRRIIRAALLPFSNDVLECEDGFNALSVYEGERPDCVLMDIGMEGLNGIRATAQITQKYPHAKIVIVTEYDDESLRRAAMDAGACAYTLKHDLLQLPEILSSLSHEV